MRGIELEARDKWLNLLESRKNERGNKYQGSRILQDNPMVKWLWFSSKYISTKNNNSNAEIQFEAEVYPSKESPMFFYLTFSKDLRDGFSIIANMDLPE